MVHHHENRVLNNFSDFENQVELVGSSEFRNLRLISNIFSANETKDLLPIPSNFDFINSIAFDKGCYLGQETSARQYFTGNVLFYKNNFEGVARKRLHSFIVSPEPIPDLEEFANAQDLYLGFKVKEVNDISYENKQKLIDILSSLKLYNQNVENYVLPHKIFFPNNNVEIVRKELLVKKDLVYNYEKNQKIKDVDSKKNVLTVIGSSGQIVYGMFQYGSFQKSKFYDGSNYFYKIVCERFESNIQSYLEHIKS